MQTYTTIQGDTWDMIALAAYGDELKATHLMQERANITLLDIQIFPAGIEVAIPDVYDDLPEEDVPEWRRE